MENPYENVLIRVFFSYVEAHACKIIDLNLAVHRAADVDNLAADIR